MHLLSWADEIRAPLSFSELKTKRPSWEYRNAAANHYNVRFTSKALNKSTDLLLIGIFWNQVEDFLWSTLWHAKWLPWSNTYANNNLHTSHQIDGEISRDQHYVCCTASWDVSWDHHLFTPVNCSPITRFRLKKSIGDTKAHPNGFTGCSSRSTKWMFSLWASPLFFIYRRPFQKSSHSRS